MSPAVDLWQFEFEITLQSAGNRLEATGTRKDWLRNLQMKGRNNLHESGRTLPIDLERSAGSMK